MKARFIFLQIKLIPFIVVLTLLTGCDGEHKDAVVVCRQESISAGGSILGSGGSGGGTHWVCSVVYIAPDHRIHRHRLKDLYVDEYLGCKHLDRVLVADVDVKSNAGGRGQSQGEKVDVSNLRCTKKT